METRGHVGLIAVLYVASFVPSFIMLFGRINREQLVEYLKSVGWSCGPRYFQQNDSLGLSLLSKESAEIYVSELNPNIIVGFYVGIVFYFILLLFDSFYVLAT